MKVDIKMHRHAQLQFNQTISVILSEARDMILSNMTSVFQLSLLKVCMKKCMNASDPLEL